MLLLLLLLSLLLLLLLQAAGIAIEERLGIKQKSEKNRKSKINKDPWWKRRLEKSIKEWRNDLGKLEEVKKGNHGLSILEKNTWTGSTNLMPRAICTLYNSSKSKY